MKDATVALPFDLIAMPKGQTSGGPIQTSAGDWVVVLPCGAGISLSQMIDMLIMAMKGRPFTNAEIAEAGAYLARDAQD